MSDYSDDSSSEREVPCVICGADLFDGKNDFRCTSCGEVFCIHCFARDGHFPKKIKHRRTVKKRVDELRSKAERYLDDHLGDEEGVCGYCLYGLSFKGRCEDPPLCLE